MNIILYIILYISVEASVYIGLDRPGPQNTEFHLCSVNAQERTHIAVGVSPPSVLRVSSNIERETDIQP